MILQKRPPPPPSSSSNFQTLPPTTDKSPQTLHSLNRTPPVSPHASFLSQETKSLSGTMASRPSAAASLGLAAAVAAAAAAGFLTHVDRFGENTLVGAPPSRDAAVQLMLLRLLVAAAAMGAFNTAVALIYARLYNAGGGVNGRITRGVYLVLFASSGVLHVFLVPQLEPGVIVDGAQELLPPLAVAVAHVLLPTAAAATFFLSMMLIYAHVGAGGGAVGDMMAIPTTTVKLLTKLVLAAALVTVVLTLTATALASYAD
ncbi:uncharacterized protein LOC127775367 [Oryza glaberrima]|uniref:uncharacterized protein LOC127775367 n=1 Tax=Oryza glaberrima TaxID=4538 RepID=UPI00224C4387|nr:uncharacterized protein LOC127775367 [Oryza glaberrima]